jgi:hypothetical protein
MGIESNMRYQRPNRCEISFRRFERPRLTRIIDDVVYGRGSRPFKVGRFIAGPWIDPVTDGASVEKHIRRTYANDLEY